MIMKFCVIGLGRFGKQVVKTLHENGAEVLGVDSSQANIEDVKNYTAQALCINIHDEAGLEAIGVDEMDVIIIGIGENFAQSILIAAILKKRSTKYKVIARATGSVQKEIFKLIGVDQVICPEEETGIALAETLSCPFTNLARINNVFSIGLINPPTNFIGKTIQELMLFDAYKINCFAIKRDEIITPINANYVITLGDKLIVGGNNHKIKQLLHL